MRTTPMPAPRARPLAVDLTQRVKRAELQKFCQLKENNIGIEEQSFKIQLKKNNLGIAEKTQEAGPGRSQKHMR